MLPYEQTLGGEAVAMYNKSGRTAQQWQELMMYDDYFTYHEYSESKGFRNSEQYTSALMECERLPSREYGKRQAALYEAMKRYALKARESALS